MEKNELNANKATDKIKVQYEKHTILMANELYEQYHEDLKQARAIAEKISAILTDYCEKGISH